MLRVLSESEATRWDDLISLLPNAHILQTWEWGQTKKSFGWQVLPLVWHGENDSVVAAALVLQRSISIWGGRFSIRIQYVPKGPLCNWQDESLRKRVLNDLAAMSDKQRAVFLKIDPDVSLGTGVPGSTDSHDDLLGKSVTAELTEAGWRLSEDQIQFRNTIVLDLKPSQEDLLASMKQKTRYNVRLANRKGVEVRLGTQADLRLLYRMYAETSLRDGFVIREEDYYRTVWTIFMQSGMAQPLIAEVGGAPVAGLWLFWFAGRAYFLYGMSTKEHREKMPNYLLQWEAMKFAKSKGCDAYDMWGAPDVFDQSDPLWGVYRFKEGLGGTIERHIGAWDLPVRPRLYYLYMQILPRILRLMRRRGEDRTKRMMT